MVWTIILLVLTIMSIIWTWRLINFAIRTANRIAVATEATAVAIEKVELMLQAAATQETKERAVAILAQRVQR